MLSNILGLRERRVDDVMVPRADIEAVQQDITLGELLRTFEKAGHSRLVVYNETLDDPVGMVHIRDLIAFMTARAAVDPEKNAKRKKPLPAGLDLKAIDLADAAVAAKIVRKILFVPPSMRVIDLLARMQATRMQLALVIDEYGGTDGLVSLEDIVEKIVGDIEDEHDDDERRTWSARPTAPSSPTRAPSSRMSRRSSATISTPATRPRTSIRSAATGDARRPRAGARRVGPRPRPFEFEVLDADPRRIKRVRITRLKESGERPRGRAQARRAATPCSPAPRRRPCPSTNAPASKDGGPSAARPAGAQPPVIAHPPRLCGRARLRLAARRSSPSSPAPRRRWRWRRSMPGRSCS